ncbi:DUF4345 domain-containing protein [uncultured Enterovirga sp.]|uniref:DUF4345 domain-containing protein n=1 Tax=uncultured Enterovirga sp. TaxID=2026352 RepID=UPI0035C9FCE2
MDRTERERRILQRVMAVGAIVPVSAGLYGILFAAGLTGDRLGGTGESHYRYLSGLLLGIGLLFWSAIPRIEDRTGRVQILTLIVVTGGLGRLVGVLLTGVPALSMIGALLMELLVTPVICLWQMRVARLYREPAATAAEAVPTASVRPTGVI